MPQPAPVEGGVGQLFQQITLVAVEVYAVDIGGVGVGGGLPRVVDDLFQLVPRSEIYSPNVFFRLCGLKAISTPGIVASYCVMQT